MSRKPNPIYIRFAYSLMLAGCLFACSPSDNLRETEQPGFNYSQYRTYTIADPVPTSSENPAFEWLQLTDRIRSELNFILPTVGLDRSTKNPDLKVYFFLVAESDNRRPVIPYQVGWRAEPFLSGGERFTEYPPNTLVLDFVDPNLDELVWRGSIHLPLENEQETYKVLSTRIKKLVQRYPDPPSRKQPPTDED